MIIFHIVQICFLIKSSLKNKHSGRLLTKEQLYLPSSQPFNSPKLANVIFPKKDKELTFYSFRHHSNYFELSWPSGGIIFLVLKKDRSFFFPLENINSDLQKGYTPVQENV